ncbi:hypothetical protein H072_9898 [Dactylellina haptotyla CBS 200.50]|uniref:Inhibitor I9 domain-containing protein n=2 Tax=Dactylellina haptotyla TaxID=430498 RepID=S8BBL6_DACHA|nr:hypothetical protein [Dactylellina haptotyla]EPS36568.1 hypothetical protein H072_9898 [Dactylellina haptotyla CBS 200.50]
MPSYIVTVKEGVPKDAAKQAAIDKGGKITHDYTLINAFAVEFPADSMVTLDAHPDVQAVEEDQVVTTQ